MQILAVVVLYKSAFEDSTTLRTLNAEFERCNDLRNQISVLVWDNSPAPSMLNERKGAFEYRHSKTNLGVAGAGNGAMEYALAQGYQWMLLLDQDTEIKTGFLDKMVRCVGELDTREEIAAIVPTVLVRGFVVSPRRQLFNRHRAYPLGQCGIAPGEAFAINSGCLMRVGALHEIGGFSTDFWLDHSDMFVFHQLFLRGKKVWRAADAELEHEMSILDYDRLMSLSRYRNFSEAESAFNDLYKGRIENAVQTARLFVRAILQRKRYRNPEFSRIAWAQMLYRLRTSKSKRIERWRADGRRRVAQETGETSETARHALP
jgi:GT2 family glycosyltransferase